MSDSGSAVTPNRCDFVRFAHVWNDGRDGKMALKVFAYFKRLVIIGVVLPGFVAGLIWAVRVESSDQGMAIVAQNTTQTATDEKKSAPTESKEAEIKPREAQESTAAKKRPLKDFKPSEQIEAEQAVDFPYDI